MSFGDDCTEPTERRPVLTEYERELLTREQWSTDQLIQLAFLARRLAARVDQLLQRGRP